MPRPEPLNNGQKAARTKRIRKARSEYYQALGEYLEACGGRFTDHAGFVTSDKMAASGRLHRALDKLEQLHKDEFYPGE